MTLDIDAVLAAITSVAASITGIRKAFDYDERPDAPPGIHNDGHALHLTGCPGEDGTSVAYELVGPGFAQWTLEIPLYTVVADSAGTKRAAVWAAPFIARYPEAFRASIQLSGTVSSSIVTGSRIVRSIPDWPGYSGFYIARHILVAVKKGAVTNTA